MATVEEILEDSEISSFREKHQGAADRIDAAAKELAKDNDKDEAILALRKSLPALRDKELHIFFSYKTADQDTARTIVEALCAGSGQLDITYQADFMKFAGQEWRDKIRTSIQQANWFILLLPDPREDWDWCLFETGIFEAHRTSADRLICLHHPDTRPPPQIEGYQAVSATIPHVEDFLKVVFVDKGTIPGMEAINPKATIKTLAQEIVDAIRPPKKQYLREIFEPWLELKCDDAAELKQADDLDRAGILDANEAALDLFGFSVAPKTWGELRADVPEKAGDGRWREQLFHVIRRIAKGRKFYPIQAVFQTEDNKMYRPVACAIDRLGDERGPIEKFHVTFTEDVAAVDHSGMPKDISALATLLRFAFRFRWEVLEKFTKGSMTETGVKGVDSAFRRMQVEWQSRGGGDQSVVAELFPAGAARDRFSAMIAEWAAIRNPQGTGELDVAIEQNDAQKVQEILKRIVPINQEFLELVTEVFSKSIHGKP